VEPFSSWQQLTAIKLFAAGFKRGLVEIMYDLNNMPKTM
jgi:hypothetical protein